MYRLTVLRSAVLSCLLLLLAPVRVEADNMVVFGDSLSDGGFFFGSRFTDPGGLLWHEYLADRLGKSRAVTGGFLGQSGLNLAVGGSQVKDLQSQVNRYTSRYTWQPGDLCTLWTGGNDLRSNPNGDMTALATGIGNIITQLAAVGVDHIIVPNLPDLGAVPESQSDPVEAAARTAATLQFNAALATQLDQRAATLGITIEQFNVFDIFTHMLLFQEDFGLSNITDRLEDTPGADPETYAFWDGIHPTTRGHALLAAAAQALVDDSGPLEIISWSINSRGELRQTWFADPGKTYTVRSGTRPDLLSTAEAYTGLSAYTVIVSSPGTERGFYQTERE